MQVASISKTNFTTFLVNELVNKISKHNGRNVGMEFVWNLKGRPSTFQTLQPFRVYLITKSWI